MTGTQLAALIRHYTKSTTTTYPDATMLVDVNNVKNELASLLTLRKNTFFIIPSTDDLVANQREYAWPSDVLNNLIMVEADFDGDGGFIQLEPYRIAEYKHGLTETNITNDFSNNEGEARYFRRRRAIYILSGTISAVTDGLRVTYRAFPADLANLSGGTDLGVDPSTTTFGMPLQLHELWARRVSVIYKSSKPKPLPLSKLEEDYEKDLNIILNAMSHEDYSDDMESGVPTPSQFDNGYNL